MITFSDKARARLVEMFKAEGRAGWAIRIRVKGREENIYPRLLVH
jgi:Fe-S cluster assembly iron-binding protein IscA